MTTRPTVLISLNSEQKLQKNRYWCCGRPEHQTPTLHPLLLLLTYPLCVRLYLSNDHKAHSAHWPQFRAKITEKYILMLWQPNSHTPPLQISFVCEALFKQWPQGPECSLASIQRKNFRKIDTDVMAAQSTKHSHSTPALRYPLCVRLSLNNDHKAHSAHWPQFRGENSENR